MAHYAYIRGSGLAADWPNGSVVTPAEFAAIDSRLYACFHEGGGTWSIGSDVTINGAHTWYFGSSTTVTVNGTLSVGLSSSYHMYVASQSHFSGISYFLGGVSISSGGTFSCGQPATFSGGISATTDPVVIDSDIELNGQSTLGPPDVGGAKTELLLLGKLVTSYAPVGSNPGRIMFYPGFSTMTGNVNVYVQDASVQVFDPGGANRSVTLQHADVEDGDWKIIINGGSANTIGIYDQTAGGLGVPLTSGGMAFCIYIAASGQWFAGTVNGY